MTGSLHRAFPVLILSLCSACGSGDPRPREAMAYQDFNCATPEGRAAATNRVSRIAKGKGFSVAFREDQKPMKMFILSVDHGRDAAVMTTFKEDQVTIALYSDSGAVEKSSLRSVYAEMAESLVECAKIDARAAAFAT